MHIKNPYLKSMPLGEFPLWGELKNKRTIISFSLEITARCNNNCRHCCINLPPHDKFSRGMELSLEQIKAIVDQAVELGAVWCLITGGEPFLREDFRDIYLYLKKKGLLVSVFTNATLINDRHIELFKRYPPRDIEVTVYGVTKKTYERVTRISGSFDMFMRGLGLLLRHKIKVRFKAMVLRSNAQELPAIAEFCRKHTKDYFRFDPFLHLRFDGDAGRNEDIRTERLAPEEIAAVEKSDPARFMRLKEGCGRLINPELSHRHCNHLFHCGAGKGSFTLSYDGYFRLCSSLWHRDCIYDLKKFALAEALQNLVPKVRDMCSDRKEFLEQCRVCPIVNLCIWCPAHAHLEAKELDAPVKYFCEVAHTREKMLSALNAHKDSHGFKWHGLAAFGLKRAVNKGNIGVGWLLCGDENLASSRIQGININRYFNKSNEANSVIINKPRHYSAQLYLNKPARRLLLHSGLDVVIFQKVYRGIAEDLARKCRDRGIKTVLLIADMPDDREMPALKIYDHIIVVSEYFKQALILKGFEHPNVTVIGDAIETPQHLRKDYDTKKEDAVIKVVWAGYLTQANIRNLEVIKKALRDDSLGDYQLVTISRDRSGVQWNLKTVWEEILKCDIAVIPLDTISPEQLMKSNNRLTMFKALGLPVICSPIPAYKDIIVDGENGFFAERPEDWIRCLNTLRDINVRRKVGLADRDKIFSLYNVNVIGGKYLRLFRELKGGIPNE